MTIAFIQQICLLRFFFFLIDKQMLYLTSFKIVQDFLNNLDILHISLQVLIQLIFPEKQFYFSSYLFFYAYLVDFIKI